MDQRVITKAKTSIMLIYVALLGIVFSGRINHAARDDWRFHVDMWAVKDETE